MPDIFRNNCDLLFNRNLLQFPNDGGYSSAQYNGRGTRLLCCDEHRDQVLIYDLPPTMDGKVLLSNHDGIRKPNSQCRNKSCCFAGEGDDELVAAAFYNGNLCIWSVIPDEKREIKEPLFVHKGKTSNMSVRYSQQNCLLATTSSWRNSIQFWSPFELPIAAGTVNFVSDEEDISVGSSPSISEEETDLSISSSEVEDISSEEVES